MRQREIMKLQKTEKSYETIIIVQHENHTTL